MKRLGLSLVSCMVLVAFVGCGIGETSGTGKIVETGGTKKDPRTLLGDDNVSKTLYSQVVTATVRIQGSTNSGSGFLINEEGYIVTNNHVVVGQSTLKVHIQDKDEKSDGIISASVVATAECADLAVIKLNEPSYNSGYLNWFTGEITARTTVGSSGFPGDNKNSYGEYLFTYTEGVIGSKPDYKSTTWASTKFFSHDSLIYGGNSGGPVIETDTGKVIGVNYAGYASSGRSFAISGDFAKRYVDRMIKGENIHSIGISPNILLNKDGTRKGYGVFVESVDTGRQASDIGMKAGDYIVSLEDTSLIKDKNLKTYCDILEKKSPNDPNDANDRGNELSIKIWRKVDPKKFGVLMIECSGKINGDKPLELKRAYYIDDKKWINMAAGNACSQFKEPL